MAFGSRVSWLSVPLTTPCATWMQLNLGPWGPLGLQELVSWRAGGHKGERVGEAKHLLPQRPGNAGGLQGLRGLGA